MCLALPLLCHRGLWRSGHQGGWLTTISLEIRAVMSLWYPLRLHLDWKHPACHSHRGDKTFFLWLRWEWGDQRPHEQCLTVTNLDDPSLVEDISCDMSYGSRAKLLIPKVLQGLLFTFLAARWTGQGMKRGRKKRVIPEKDNILFLLWILLRILWSEFCFSCGF